MLELLFSGFKTDFEFVMKSRLGERVCHHAVHGVALLPPSRDMPRPPVSLYVHPLQMTVYDAIKHNRSIMSLERL